MKYLIVDDEVNASNLLKRILDKYPGLSSDDEITVFNDSVAAYDHIVHEHVDLIFLDIEMPRLSGEDIANKISAMADGKLKPYIIFITAFPQYSLFAWNTGAVGYIIKPYSPESVYEAIEKFKKLSAFTPAANKALPKPVVRCFPDFEVFVCDQPIFFKNKKSKELLALLVHNRGNWVSLDKVTMCLFENLDEISSKNYLRTVLHRLKKTLEGYDLHNIIDSKYGGIRIDTAQIDCDYYEYLKGNTALFNGEYMNEYPWAKATEKFMSARML